MVSVTFNVNANMILAILLVAFTTQMIYVLPSPLDLGSIPTLPLDSENEVASEEFTLKDVQPPVSTEDVQDDEEKKEDNEFLDTASSIAFRPLFVYRQKMAKRKRIHGNCCNKLERRVARRPSGYGYYYPSHYKNDFEFPAIF